ncbi:KCNC1-like protein [Mya arenaria]|uniref:KCNC1-like protein n=1 Tax=Mya arenaria TaxID=6604 RepID=A0ABY7F3D5_MYAAR|nr:KCNC1-like protein [Mya arenaria]
MFWQTMREAIKIESKGYGDYVTLTTGINANERSTSTIYYLFRKIREDIRKREEEIRESTSQSLQNNRQSSLQGGDPENVGNNGLLATGASQIQRAHTCGNCLQLPTNMTSSSISLTVSGNTITVDRQMIEDGPESKLSQICEKDSVNITRPAEMFLSILAFYQTGQLHMPVSACPAAFLEELTFWEISPDLLSQCCKNRLQAFLDEQETLESFRESQRRLDNITPSKISFGFCTKLRSFRANIWSVTGSNNSFLLTRVRFIENLEF